MSQTKTARSTKKASTAKATQATATSTAFPTPGYFRIQSLGDRHDKTLAFFRAAPDGLARPEVTRLRRGQRLGARAVQLTVVLDANEPGDQLASLLGNTQCLVVVEQAMKDVLATTCTSEVEFVPVRVVDGRKRERSASYWIVNPIGTVDVVDRDASAIDYDDDGVTILGVRSLVFRRDRLATAPALLRVPEKPEDIYINVDMIRALAPHGFTNVILHEIESR